MSTKPASNSEGIRQALGLGPGLRVWVGGHNFAAKSEIEQHVVDCVRPPSGAVDVAFVTPSDTDEAAYFITKVATRLVPDGRLWLVVRHGRPDDRSIDDDAVADVARRCASSGWQPGVRCRLSEAFFAIEFRPGG